MKIVKHYRYMAPLKGLILFVTLFIVPQYLGTLLLPRPEQALSRSLLFTLTIIIAALLIEQSPFKFCLLSLKAPRPFTFLRYPLIAVGLYAGAISLTYLVNLVFFLAPLPHWLVEWYRAPNPAIPQFIGYLEQGQAGKVVIMALIVTVGAPIIEEILFRGYLQPLFVRFRLRIGLNIDIWLTALIFAAFHLNSLANTLFAFVIGLFLSLYRRRSGKVGKAIAIHSLVNVIGLVLGVVLFKLFGDSYF